MRTTISWEDKDFVYYYTLDSELGYGVSAQKPKSQ